jgi:hypothetical protein
MADAKPMISPTLFCYPVPPAHVRRVASLSPTFDSFVSHAYEQACHRGLLRWQT